MSHRDQSDKIRSQFNRRLDSAYSEVDSKSEEISMLKEDHRIAMKKMTATHARELSSKNHKLKQANDLVAGMQEMFEEMSKEVLDATATAQSNIAALDRAKKKAAHAHARYIEQKLISGELNDEVCSADNAISDVEADLKQSQEMIDYLYSRLEEQERDFNQIVAYIDKYYSEEAAQPKVIAKHYVRNRDGKGNVL